ncbi:MAG TPA: hypothetical protein VF824_05115 [Thermoanaerobaculia bacterium]|jgi:hypothetical protein
MRRIVFLGFLLFLPTFLFADEWQQFDVSGCIGGSRCNDRTLRVPLDDRPVIAIRFRANDNIGETAGGVLRIKIDGTVVRGSIDIPRSGQLFTLDVDAIRGRTLSFEPAANDEVQIDMVGVLYGERAIRRQPPTRMGGSGGGWRSYPNANGCIGGDECRKNGTRITIALEDAPVLGVRFFAHDNVGTRADGKLTVKIDDTTVGWYIDVQRNGKRHELDVDNIRGSRLVIATANDDEVEVRDIEVLYGVRTRGGQRYEREITHEGGCIGGDECGGSRARIRIALYGRPVESIRFYARDDIGTRAGGELRVRIDDEVLRDYLDIPREGRVFTIDGRHLAGDYLYIEPAEDDEVVVRDVRVRFGEEEEDD